MQQQAAYAHLAGERDLAIVTGIVGAGKSRLQRDVAVAYEEAGYRVIGAEVAGDAARTLGEEAAIEARTVAKLLADLEVGRDRLDSRSVLMIGEAGTLGAAQAKALFEQARDAGSRVLLLGDVSQHESVGRGAVLRGLAEQHNGLGMRESRRTRTRTIVSGGDARRQKRLACPNFRFLQRPDEATLWRPPDLGFAHRAQGV